MPKTKTTAGRTVPNTRTVAEQIANLDARMERVAEQLEELVAEENGNGSAGEDPMAIVAGLPEPMRQRLDDLHSRAIVAAESVIYLAYDFKHLEPALEAVLPEEPPVDAPRDERDAHDDLCERTRAEAGLHDVVTILLGIGEVVTDAVGGTGGPEHKKQMRDLVSDARREGLVTSTPPAAFPTQETEPDDDKRYRQLLDGVTAALGSDFMLELDATVGARMSDAARGEMRLLTQRLHALAADFSAS